MYQAFSAVTEIPTITYSQDTMKPPYEDTLRTVLATSVSSGTFNDTAYYLYSRRYPDGRVGFPRIAYANSRVLKAASDHFQARK